ncbi:hypothetical protein ABW20_dc0109481 [Dactylellina cionopaga]|nr:hypothetical protein ABW20_dc0109481 [Dactylellina cionopaga]
MSEPTNGEPLPRKADIPAQRLSRPSPTKKLSPKATFTLGQAGTSSGDGSSSVSRPAAAVTRDSLISPVDAVRLHDTSFNSLPVPLSVDTSSDVGFSRERPIEGLQETDIDAETGIKIGQSDTSRPFRPRIRRSGSKDPYEPSTWNKFTGFTRSSGTHRQILEKVFKPEAKAQFAYACDVGYKPSEEALQECTNPHTWRQRKLVTSSKDSWTTFTSIEIWVAIMLGIFNFGGTVLIAIGIAIIFTTFGKLLPIRKKLPARGNTTTRTQYYKGNSETTKSVIFLCLCGFGVMLVLWPILACTISPPKRRGALYPSRCSGGDWDYRVILDGRVQPSNLTKGSVEIIDLRQQSNIPILFTTKDFVNTTWKRTEENILLMRATDAPLDREFVSEVSYRFPYLWTTFEGDGWVSLSDIPRTRNGNYSAVLKDPVANSTRTISGEFPYLDDGSGLRLDGLALIPDVKRSWRTIASSTDDCPWGPDAKLLENTDVTARDMTGDGHAVLQTDMTKFSRCSELTVCANRRKQTVEGLEYARGEDGKRVLDEMLIVPLGLLLVEQIRWGSCCGDGFDPYTVGVPKPSPSPPTPDHSPPDITHDVGGGYGAGGGGGGPA